MSRFVAFALVFFASTRAFALGPVHVEVAGKVGYGTNPGGGDTTPLGAGIGGRAGVEFLGGVYGGLSGIYYLGSGEGVSANANNVLGAGQTFGQHALLFGVEGGYGFHLSVLTIRPQLGLGEATFTDTAHGFDRYESEATIEDSKTYVYFEPGLTALVNVGPLIFGLDSTLLLVPSVANEKAGSGGVEKASSKTYAAFTTHAEVGVHF